jgi:hypothetical protein
MDLSSTVGDNIDADLNELPAREVTDTQAKKKNYAERLSRLLAIRLANALRATFPGILPDELGRRQESKARTSKGYKKLDINYSTTELGLGLGVSIKTLNFRDPKTQRYTKNYTRVDNELRAEASDYHERQPYAVMVAIIFLPLDSCTDGKTTASSFAQSVLLFRHRAGRAGPNDSPEKFERIFMALYETRSGPEFGRVRCFDVFSRPPKNGPPTAHMTMTEMISEIVSTYDDRNNTKIDWADEAPKPEDLQEIIQVAQEEEDDEDEA